MHFSREWEWRLGSNLGGHVMWGLVLMEPSTAVQSLLSGLGEAIVVIHCSDVDGFWPQLLLLFLASPCSPQGDLPFSWVCSTIAPSNSIKSSIFKATAAVTSSPACWPSKALAESSSMPPAHSPWLIGTVSSVSVLGGFLNYQSNFSAHSVSRFPPQNHRGQRTRWYALISTTSQSNASNRARCFHYSTEIVVFWLSFLCSITWPLRPRVVVWAAWCYSPGLRWSFAK